MPTETPEALADLLEVSSEIEAAVVLGADGVEASAGLDGAGAEALARAANDLLATAASGRGAELAHVVVTLPEGGVFVVREAGLTVAATTCASPTSGLVLYDLRACLRRLAETDPHARRQRKRADAPA